MSLDIRHVLHTVLGSLIMWPVAAELCSGLAHSEGSIPEAKRLLRINIFVCGFRLLRTRTHEHTFADQSSLLRWMLFVLDCYIAGMFARLTGWVFVGPGHPVALETPCFCFENPKSFGTHTHTHHRYVITSNLQKRRLNVNYEADLGALPCRRATTTTTTTTTTVSVGR